eukprot:g2013.t1
MKPGCQFPDSLNFDVTFSGVDADDLLNNVIKNESQVQRVIDFMNRRQSTEIEKNRKIVIVKQGELARVDTKAENGVLLASDEATTCVIAVAHCTKSCLVSIAHFDDRTTTPESINQWLTGMQEPSVFLMGDYLTGSARRRQSLSAFILWHINGCQDLTMKIELCCVQGLNTREDRFPKSYDLMYDVDKQVAYPQIVNNASVPAANIRSAFYSQSTSSSRLIEVYQNGGICIPAFQIQTQWYMNRFLNEPDSVLLSLFSSSPLHEKPTFVEDMRSQWRWILSLTDQERNLPRLHFNWSKETGWKS